MVTKKKNTKKKKSWKSTLFYIICLLLAPLCGVVVFNFDRLDYLGEQGYVLKQFMPRWMKWFLPENNAEYAVLPPGSEIEARVVEVYDGDTVTVLSLDGKNKYRIRFYGIDAPESGQPYGDEARLALHRKLYGRQIAIGVIDSDVYGRAISKVYYDNIYINLEMVAEGYAYHYYQYAKRDMDFPLAEQQAKSRGLGVWLSPGGEMPWDYRKRIQKRGKGN